MSNLIDDEPENGAGGANTPEFSVSELSGAVKKTVEGAFGHVRVRGEIGRVSRPRSGHIYLDLKDDRAVLAGIIWKGVAVGLPTQPEEGMEVVATGRLTTFPGQSRYQIVIESLAPAGVGALMAMLEKRRRALAAEGLFDEARKRPLPYLPRKIGVVTSPSGAVIRDILHRLAERFPVKVLVWPVAVQGAACAPEVAAAIDGFSAMLPSERPDVVIVARGGGSVEDLWGFNEEAVVRAAAASAIPLISAVGHETDTTLIDYVSDRRAPTPTAAAEMAVPVRADLLAYLADLQARRLRALESGLERRRQRLTDLGRALPRPEQLLAERRQRLDLAVARLPRPARMIAERRQAVALLAARLPTPKVLLADQKVRLERVAGRLGPALRQSTQGARLQLTRQTARLGPGLVANQLKRGSERLSDRAARLRPAVERRRQTARDRLLALGRTLGVFSYERTLERGYAVVRDSDGSVVARGADMPTDGLLEIQFQDLRVAAQTGSDPVAPSKLPSAPKPKAKRKPKADAPDQGSLF